MCIRDRRFVMVLLPMVFVLPRPAVSWRNLASYGLLIGVGQFGLLFIAMNGHIAPGLASLVIQIQVFFTIGLSMCCLLYTSDAADDLTRVDLGGRRLIKK